MSRRFVFGKNKPKPFISLWDTTKTSTGSSANNQVKLPLLESFPYRVDWGDGVTNVIASASDVNLTHTYAASGVYTIKILSPVKGFYFDNTGDRLKILKIIDWGDYQFTGRSNLGGNFNGCANLTLADVIGFPKVITSLRNVFGGCTSLTTINNLSMWDVSNVQLFISAFINCSNFNDGGLSNWNTANMTNPSIMFQFAGKFNQPLNWNFSKVTTMANMFFYSGFNQSVSNWDVSKVTAMNDIFNGCGAFVQPLDAWNINKNVTMNNFMLNKTNYPPALWDAFLLKFKNCVVGTGRTQKAKTFQTYGKRTAASQAAVDALLADG